jgi:hypothetical protein
MNWQIKKEVWRKRKNLDAAAEPIYYSTETKWRLICEQEMQARALGLGRQM